MSPIKSILERGEKTTEIKIGSDIPVYIYGAGNIGRELVALLRGKGYRISAIIDQRGSSIGSIDGIDVFDLQELLRSSASDAKEAICLISIFNPNVDCARISLELKRYFNTVISFPKVLWHFHHEMGDRYWLTIPEYYDNFASEIDEVYSMLADDRSREVLLNNLKFRLEGEYNDLVHPDLTGQYFPSDIPRWMEPLRLMDCGAYDGDTIRKLASSDYSTDAFVAFEPDLLNFNKLVATSVEYRNLRPACKERIILPCGVSNATKTLSFNSGFGAASQICSVGDISIQCVAIDEILPDFRPNLIKMDIEGAELDALHGCRGTIDRFRPGLAICVYHKPNDIWTIPFAIREMVAGTGKYYMRSHCYNGFDLVLYWQPERAEKD
jgi:FkbM family methyltransferase